jgi:hypothetical protein
VAKQPTTEAISKPLVQNVVPVEDGWSETKKRDKKQAPKERLPSEDSEPKYRPKTPVREPEVVAPPQKVEAKAAPQK